MKFELRKGGNAIKSTPISWSGGEDKLTWVHSRSGNFTVKSGYHLAFQLTEEKDRGQDSSSSKLNSILWKKIWNLKSPPRLKHFLWRIIRNAVSTKENLFARKCARSPICGLCGAEIETIEHVLLRCEWTEEVWANSGIEFPRPVNKEVSIKKWFVNLLVNWGGQFMERMGLIGQICWAIWKQRNEWVFLQQMPNSKVALKRAMGLHGEFLAANCSQINDAVIESDCQPLVNMLQPKSVLKNWTIQAFLDDISSFSANSSFVFSWCNRQANRCANWIACNSRLGVGIPLAPCNIPDELYSLIRSDL
ncbi:hypothetical protein RHSIM_Rhsim11G0140100 [Rhododendron simsii]|uniref:Reverse transcriptase zinc-binding domain-containing protein n=1 Tax=Rhododendron simsii TaxID=118357 RepID=A0A834GCL0_RHOSS|nr:hypothetical protein RHSIM_Rhsim11G0140100 [Rhododendron simsii]